MSSGVFLAPVPAAIICVVCTVRGWDNPLINEGYQLPVLTFVSVQLLMLSEFSVFYWWFAFETTILS